MSNIVSRSASSIPKYLDTFGKEDGVGEFDGINILEVWFFFLVVDVVPSYASTTSAFSSILFPFWNLSLTQRYVRYLVRDETTLGGATRTWSVLPNTSGERHDLTSREFFCGEFREGKWEGGWPCRSFAHYHLGNSSSIHRG